VLQTHFQRFWQRLASEILQNSTAEPFSSAQALGEGASLLFDPLCRLNVLRRPDRLKAATDFDGAIERPLAGATRYKSTPTRDIHSDSALLTKPLADFLHHLVFVGELAGL
jgi:hypothetical protein